MGKWIVSPASELYLKPIKEQHDPNRL